MLELSGRSRLLPTQRHSLMSPSSTIIFSKSDDSVGDNINNIDHDQLNLANKTTKTTTSKMHLYRNDASLDLNIDEFKLVSDIEPNTSVSAMAQKICDEFNICIDNNVTLLYALLYYTCGIKNDSKLQKICNIFPNIYVFYMFFRFIYIWIFNFKFNNRFI